MITNYYKLFFLILLMFDCEYLSSQSTLQDSIYRKQSKVVDSLLKALDNSKTDSARLRQYYELVQFINITGDSSNSKIYEYYADKAMLLANKANFKRGKCWALFLLGKLAWVKFDHAGALKDFLAALRISDEINDKACSRNLCLNIGRVYSEVINPEEAVKYLKRSLELAKQDNAHYQEVKNCLGYLGNVYEKLGRYDEALKCYFEYIDVHNNNSKYKVGDSLVSYYIGTIYRDMGNYSEALKYLFMGLKYFTRDGFKNQICLLNMGIGKVYNLQAAGLNDPESKEKYREAINYFLTSLKISQEIDFRITRIDVYQGLAISYEGIGDSKKGLNYLKLYQKAKDSIYNADLYKKVSVVNTENALEKEQLEERARQDLLLANEKLTRERLLGEQKLEQEKMLADERFANEKKNAEQKLEVEKKSAEQKNKYDKSIAEEKAKQEKLKAEKLQTNNMLLMGLGLVVITSVFLIFYIRQRNEKKRAVEKAEAIHKMAELEMQSLRSQLNPHFMFNSLNALQTLILAEESDKSQSYLAQFSKMLRMLLENADKPFISLQKEIDFLQLYLGLEEMRVPELQYSISTDPGLNTEQTLIPNMILQPYVENAIWHGLSHKESDKQVKIRIYRQNGKVNCEVEDNGIGRKKAEELKSLFRKQHQSKGMELLTKRFRLLNEEYGSNIEAIITDMKINDQDSGTLVTIKIPVMQSA